MAADLTALTIVETGALLRSKRLSAVELVEAHLERAALDPDLNTIATLTERRAREDAERADRELAAGQDRRPLHRIPITLKDNIHLAGDPPAAGARPPAPPPPRPRNARRPPPPRGRPRPPP